jgi:hypothetical protein
VFTCDEAGRQTSDEGQGFIFLALMGAFAVTLLAQVVASGRVHWGRAWGAWGALILALGVVGTGAGVVEIAMPDEGVGFIPVAAFLATIVPPRDARWTGCALLAGVVLFATSASYGWWAAIVLAPLPLIGAEVILARRSRNL